MTDEFRFENFALMKSRATRLYDCLVGHPRIVRGRKRAICVKGTVPPGSLGVGRAIWTAGAGSGNA
jgi:hypothetical protein